MSLFSRLARVAVPAIAFAAAATLSAAAKARHYKIVNVGLTYVAPMGFYSKKIKSFAELKEGAKVGIQNDPSNGNRALLLLQKSGVIKLKAGAGTNGNNATPRDPG